jgi:glyoxylate/hydroxypyruvate reductase A
MTSAGAAPLRIAVSVDADEAAAVVARFAAELPGADVQDGRDALPGADYVVVGVRDEMLFERQRAMKAVFGFGAGVNGILALPGLPPHVPLIRLEDAGMAAQMARYVLATALRVLGRLDVYARQQRVGQWRRHPPRAPAEFAVGVLGLGVIGTAIARALVAQGFAVRGHAQTRKAEDGIACHAGAAEFDAFLSALELLVVVVPLTPHTRGIVDARALALLADGAHVLNIGRGPLVVDADLIAALDAGKLGGATLDVFAAEPLPPEHPFWSRDDVAVTPHVSGTTLPGEAIAQIAAKIRRLEQNLPVSGVVERTRGY